MSERKFWLVKGSGPTNHEHDSRASAKAEAERLARLNPGSTFTVLEAVAAVVVCDTHWTTFGGARYSNSLDEDLPF